MNCPVCEQTQLVLADRQGIEIDYCPKCRGVWLDRGELDKLIERSIQATAPAAPSYRSEPYAEHGHHHKEGHNYKRKSFWHEIFD